MTRAFPLASPAATRAFGRRLGALLRPGDFVALSGGLGAGKTLLVRGAAEGAGVPAEEHASSPTFALVHVYRGGQVPLQHMDLYRLQGEAELFALGFDDLLAEPAATLCEWAERAGAMLPGERLEVALEIVGERERVARVEAKGARAEELLAGMGEGKAGEKGKARAKAKAKAKGRVKAKAKGKGKARATAKGKGEARGKGEAHQGGTKARSSPTRRSRRLSP